MRYLSTMNNPIRQLNRLLFLGCMMVSLSSLPAITKGEMNPYLSGFLGNPFSLEKSFYYGYDVNMPQQSMITDCVKNIDIQMEGNSYYVKLEEVLGLPSPPSNAGDYYYYIYKKGGRKFYCGDTGKKWLIIVNNNKTGESCSTWANVRDVKAPDINCSQPVTVHCQASLKDVTITYSDNCTPTSEIYTSYVDKKIDVNDCTIFSASSQIDRHWTVWDKAGNSNTCVQTIYISRPPMSAVQIPGNVVLECPNTDTDPSATGVPTINGKPFDHLCGIIVSYKDFVRQECGKTFSIWRTWKITDCCTWVVKEKVQMITVKDTDPPVVECPADITLGTNRNSTARYYTIPSPTVSDECHGDDVDIEVNLDDFVKLDPGKVVNLEKGEHTIEYKVTDPCGNMTTCSYKVTIEDQDPPVIGCEDITVTVDIDQILEICIEDLDNFTATDNCGPVDIMIRKNQDFCEDDEDDLIYDDCVHFCCEDGNRAYVTIKATDQAGNMSICRFRVTVIGPMGDLMISIPPEKTINCDQPIIFDEPTVTSICIAEVDIRCDTLEDTRDICGLGTFTKRFIATNVLNGDMDSAIQTVIIVNPRPFGIDNILCPGNITVEGCFDGDAGDIGDIDFTGLNDLACYDIDTAVASSISSTPDSCIIITRTWRITDKCQPDSVWICEQIIVVNDSEPPVLSGASNQTVPVDSNCLAQVTIGPVTATDCDTAVEITNSYGGGNTIDTVLTTGSYRIEFYGEDDCGNVDTLAIEITIVDEELPEIECADIELACGDDIPDTTPRASDNCGVDSVRLISETPNLDDCGKGTITRVYRAWDSSLNSATCAVTITIVGNNLFDETNITWPVTPIVTFECTEPGLVPGGVTTVDTAGIPCIDVYVFSQDSAGSDPAYCAVIFRKWTVIDSCNFDPMTGAGRWDSVQVIAVNDTTPPQLSGPRDITAFSGPDCMADVELDSVIATDCDPNVIITNDQGGGAKFTGTFGLGSHTVTFTGVDSCGNRNALSINILVEDTTPPTLVCRDDMTVMCGDPVPSIFPQLSEECPGGSLRVDTVRIDMPCDLDTVLLIFTAADGSGNPSAVCTTKVIYVTDPFDCDLITLEQDTIDLDDCEASLDPDSIEMSRPVIPDFGGCHGFKIFFSDESASQGTGPFCNVMITRTWKIVDTCTPAPHDTCIKMQVIRIADSIPPQLLVPPDTCHFATAIDSFASFITLDPAIARDCDPDVTITNNFNDQGARIADFFPLGGTTIVFTAEDACGNIDVDSMLVEVKDTIPVQFTCVKLFRHVSDDPVPEVRVLAHEFVSSVTGNNFTDSTDLKFSFTTAVADTVRTFGCDSIGVVVLTVFVTDLSGNQDTCQPLLRVLDTINGGICPPLNLLGTIAGNIATEKQVKLNEVQVNSSSQDGVYAMTDENGHYQFDNVTMGTKYILTPSKHDENVFNGVTTLDLLDIQKHILGIELLPSPYAMIAADINRSGDVTTLDVALLQLMILGRIQEDADLGWRFVDKNFEFPVKSNPWHSEFPEHVLYNPLNKNEMATDFVAIKLGDVNGSAVATGSSEATLRNQVNVTMVTPERLVKPGEKVEVLFKLNKAATLEAMQWTLDYDEDYLTLISSENELFESAVDKGKIHYSWMYARGAYFEEDMTLNKVTFIAKDKGMLSHLIHLDNENPAEVYVADAGVGNVLLDFNELSSSDYVLYQNRPNPFTDRTQIQFYIPSQIDAALKVFDPSGKLLYEHKGSYQKGLHTVDVELDQIVTGGMLYYQLETADYIATKKMIVLK